MVTALIIGAVIALIVAAKEDTPSDSQKGGYQSEEEARKQREIHRSMFTKCGTPMF